MNLLFEEIKKITRRKQFWIIFIILFGSVFVDFYLTCVHYYGKPLSVVPSAYHCITICNYFPTPASRIFKEFLLTLAASIIASDIYFEEKRMGVNNCIFTRVSKRHYLYQKIAGIAIVVFGMVTVAIFLSIVLALSAFPLQGNYTSMVPFKKIMEPDKNHVLSYLKAYYPYLNVIVFAWIRGVFASTSAILAFSVSFVKKTNQYFIILSSTIFYILYTLITYFFGSMPLVGDRVSQIIQTEILSINPLGSIWMFVLYLFFQIVISAVLIRRGIKFGDEY